MLLPLLLNCKEMVQSEILLHLWGLYVKNGFRLVVI